MQSFRPPIFYKLLVRENLHEWEVEARLLRTVFT
jgi:hypothetical protein